MTSPIRWQQGDPYIYLYVNERWYRYSSASSPVGQGAMGIVYLGFDCETNEKVAIKMLRQEFWHDQLVRNRSRLEASITINHPNVIRMLGYCEDPSLTGPLYVLSEYVCGVTFKEHVEHLSYFEADRDLKFKKIVSEFLPVLDAVETLHSLGVIHRDIKPSNLMFQDGHILKLMDLGIAKADYFFDAHLKGFIGSRPYAAPEQIVDADTEAQIDIRVDIHALGVTLACLLVGHFPIVPSDNVPKPLDSIIRKATSYSPDDRYQHAYQMCSALSAYLSESHDKKKPSAVIVTVISVVALLAVLVAVIVIMNL